MSRLGYEARFVGKEWMNDEQWTLNKKDNTPLIV